MDLAGDKCCMSSRPNMVAIHVYKVGDQSDDLWRHVIDGAHTRPSIKRVFMLRVFAIFTPKHMLELTRIALLIYTTHWVNAADGKLMIFFLLLLENVF